MKIRIRGDDETCTAARPQFAEHDVEIESDRETAVDLELVASADSDTLRAANSDAIAESRPVVLVELGGIGGRAIDGVEGGLIVASPAGPCYQCLERRVEAIHTDAPTIEDRPSPSVRRILGAVAGWVAFHAEQPPYGGRLIEFPWTERTVHPVPDCPACDGNGRWTAPSETPASSRSLDEAIAAVETVIDEHVGIVKQIGEADSEPLPYYLAQLADTAAFSAVTAPQQAAGVAEDWNRALMKGVGEALERYAAGIYRESDFRMASIDTLEDAIHPARFVRPSDWETIDEPLPWVPGTSLRESEHRWVPAEVVVFPPPRRDIRPAITTGLALGNTPEEARAAGLAEVIERDATMLAWYSTYEPVGVRVDDDRFDRLVRHAELEGLSVSTTLVTQDVDVPVIAAAVHREGDFPRFALGSAAGLDPVDTAIDALREAIQNWMELAAMGPEGAAAEAPRITDYGSDPGAAREFMSPETILDATSLGSQSTDGDSSLDNLVERTVQAGMEPIAVTTTTRDLDSLGFHATRILVPTAQPLFTGSAYFGERAKRIPTELGFEPRLDRDPHPFP